MSTFSLAGNNGTLSCINWQEVCKGSNTERLVPESQQTSPWLVSNFLEVAKKNTLQSYI